MKAALLVEPGRIEIDEVANPVPGPGEVAISVIGVGLCGSDLSVFSGKWTAPTYPWIMGHEAFGTIVGVGPQVPSDRVGETVVIEPNIACASCDECRRGWTSGCQGRVSVGMNRQGALAELLVVPSDYAWAISGVPETDIVCVEPTTVVTAALRRMGAPPPAAAAVVGVGAQGLMMTLALLERGVDVYVHDVNADRVAFAVSLGAKPLDTAAGRFPLVVDTVGSPRSTAGSIEHLEVGGTLLFLGLDNRPLDLTAQTVVRRQLHLVGSLTYDHPGDFEAAVALVREGSFAPGRVITDEYPFEDAQEAFDRGTSSRGKTWIRVVGDN